MWAGERVGTYTKDKLKQYATTITGIDTTKFNQCLDTDQTRSIVQADIQQAQQAGVRGTPTFLANGKSLQITSLDFSQFSKALDTLLK